MPIVLFVCSGNYYRSRFAEIYFNSRAAATGLPWRAESRGFRLHPQNVGPISPHTITGLAKLGLSPPSPLRSPLVLAVDDLARAARVVAVKEAEHRPMMQCYFPDWVERIGYWRIDDIDCAAPDDALSMLQSHVDALLGDLLNSASPGA